MKNNKLKNKYELEKLLIRGLGDEIDLDPFAEKPTIITGKYHGKEFLIHYESESYIMFSIEDSVIDELDDFIKLLSSAIKSKPILSMVSKNVKGKPGSNYLYIEWENKNPIVRINRIKEELEKTGRSNIISIDFFEDEKKLELKK